MDKRSFTNAFLTSLRAAAKRYQNITTYLYYVGIPTSCPSYSVILLCGLTSMYLLINRSSNDDNLPDLNPKCAIPPTLPNAFAVYDALLLLSPMYQSPLDVAYPIYLSPEASSVSLPTHTRTTQLTHILLPVNQRPYKAP